jgi:hypothetical protein
MSERLLRQWIGKGIIPMFSRPSASHRSGISEDAIRDFLRHIVRGASFGLGPHQGRRQPAREKCVAAASQLKDDEELTPNEFAEKAGVSVTTVRRLAGEDAFDSYRPTSRRCIICTSVQKYRKEQLTRKRGKMRW